MVPSHAVHEGKEEQEDQAPPLTLLQGRKVETVDFSNERWPQQQGDAVNDQDRKIGRVDLEENVITASVGRATAQRWSG